MNSTPFLWLIAVPILAAPVVYLIGRLDLRGGGQERSAARWAALIGLLAAWGPFVRAANDLAAAGPAIYTLGAVSLRLDGLSLLLAALSLGLGTMVVLFSGPYMSGEAGEEKYYAMLVAMVGVMIGLGSAADIFNLWLWFEAMAITSYLLVVFYREQAASLEAGIKYVVQSATGSVLVLVGIAIVLATTGSLDLETIRGAAVASPALLAAAALFIVGFGVKAALAPMHTWLPDAHSQAPSGISAMLSGVVIEAGLVAMLRVAAALADVTPSWGVLLMLFGTANMVLGNLMALRQTQVKRLLAFSSVAQVGYMLLGLGVAFYAGEVAGAQGGFFHMLNHGLMKGLAFMAAGALLWALHTAAGDHEPLTVRDLNGAARRYPIAALTLSIAVLGLGGLPPLAGFMSKWQILVAGFETHNLVIAGLMLFAGLNSVLSLGYYAPLVNAVYREAPSAAVMKGQALPVVFSVPLLLMALAVVALGVYPQLATWLTAPAGQALLAAFGR